ncbi:MAG: 4-hydroxy-tetrahydrodipicolinate synthase [Candidatus Liptonbacteria bacterium]|nr:4-hydroxy-tetrahydrodipicolinate synthase [Candidatus Liptonbacteria bacterium]
MKPFTGCGTALVTPFRTDLSLDDEALRQLVDRQINAGIDFLVPCGTTGESPTLSHEEHRRVVEIVIEQAAGRVPVIAGTGSNSTAEALDLTRHAKTAGATGCLIVSPYYNKPTQNGLLAHFNAIADVGLPVVIYNIPGRTGVNITPETMAKLTEHPNIVGIKEATGNLEQMTQDILLCGERATYLSGDDTLTIPLMSIGGHGVISVISNLIPRETTEMVHAALDEDWNRARKIHLRLFPLCRAMFLETNPIPVKAAMAMMGLLKPAWRLPMTPPAKTTASAIEEQMREVGLEISIPSAKLFASV